MPRALLAVPLLAASLVGCGGPPNLEYQAAEVFKLPVGSEGSGAAYHSGRDSMFVVDDEGSLMELDWTGALLNAGTVESKDTEAVAVDPASGLVYLAVESEDRLVEVDPDTWEVRRSFPLIRELDGETVLVEGGDGIEGLTFVPDDADPDGGRFYAAVQGGGGEQPMLVELSVPLRTSTSTSPPGRVTAAWPTGDIELSAVHWDSRSEQFLLLSDDEDLLLTVQMGGDLGESWVLPAGSLEGLSVDRWDSLIIVDEIGEIVRLSGWRTEELR